MTEFPVLSVIVSVDELSVDFLADTLHRLNRECAADPRIQLTVNSVVETETSRERVQSCCRDFQIANVYLAADVNPISSGASRNRAWLSTDGQAVLEIQAGMIWQSGTFEAIVDAFQLGDAGIVHTPLRVRNRTLIDSVDMQGDSGDRFDGDRLTAYSRALFEFLRGIDERLLTRLAQDRDLLARSCGAGAIQVLLPRERGEFTRAAEPLSDVERKRLRHDTGIIELDNSLVRNLTARYLGHLRMPTVTVAIVTRNRPEYLREALESVLVQSMQDFEVVIIDDGSEGNDAELLIADVADSRIRYVYQQASGISAARNHATRLARGAFIAVCDDDDLMHPKRLEWQLSEIRPGLAGAFGTFMNFSHDGSAPRVVQTRYLNRASAVLRGDAPGHGTWLVRSDVMRTMPYDETLSSGVDNNLILRMVHSGYEFAHAVDVVLLRRLHDQQVTVGDGNNQKDSALQSLGFLAFGLTSEAQERLAAEREVSGGVPFSRPQELAHAALPYLPDGLVKRRLVITGALGEELPQQLDGELRFFPTLRNGNPGLPIQVVEEATYRDMLTLRAAGLDWVAEALPDEDGEVGGVSRVRDYWLSAEIDNFATSQGAELEGAVLVSRVQSGANSNAQRLIALDIDGERIELALSYYASVEDARNALKANGDSWFLSMRGSHAH